eukprot:gene14903-6043_t
MKRKQKCGNDKRNENKKKALVAAALAPGQKSLVGMFSQQTVKPSSSISKESIEAPEVVHVGEEKFASSSKEKNEQNDKQNEIKQPKRKETINGVMNISLNGIGTAYYDPRPGVFTFLKKKDRRNAQPCSELYKQRDFVRKFFQSDNGCL